MTEPEKPNWGNRIVLLVFGLTAVLTIGATVFATTSEWAAGNFRSDQVAAELAAEAEAEAQARAEAEAETADETPAP